MPPKSTAERTINNGSTFDTFTKLPIALSDHCMVSLNGSDKGDFFLAGDHLYMKSAKFRILGTPLPLSTFAEIYSM